MVMAKEIFFAEEAKFLAHEIGERADQLNARGFGHLFALYRSHALIDKHFA
jgi:hypothetical protein